MGRILTSTGREVLRLQQDSGWNYPWHGSKDWQERRHLSCPDQFAYILSKRPHLNPCRLAGCHTRASWWPAEGHWETDKGHANEVYLETCLRYPGCDRSQPGLSELRWLKACSGGWSRWYENHWCLNKGRFNVSGSFLDAWRAANGSPL